MHGGTGFIRTIGDFSCSLNIEKMFKIGSCRGILRDSQGGHPRPTARKAVGPVQHDCVAEVRKSGVKV